MKSKRVFRSALIALLMLVAGNALSKEEQVRIVANFGDAPGFMSTDMYLTYWPVRPLIEMKGEDWYKKNILANDKPRSLGGVKYEILRDGTIHFYKDKRMPEEVQQALSDLQRYLDKKPFVVYYPKPDSLDFATASCDDLRRFVRLYNAARFRVYPGWFEAPRMLLSDYSERYVWATERIPSDLRAPILTKGTPGKSANTDSVFDAINKDIATWVDKLENHTSEISRCTQLTNDDFMGIPTKEEYLEAQRLYPPIAYENLIKHPGHSMEVRFIRQFHDKEQHIKTKQRNGKANRPE